MRTKFKGRLSLLFLALALMLAFPAVAIAADGINADADNLATGTANHSNSFSANQQAGTTKSYDFSAFIKNDGNDNNNVFATTSDKVTTTNAFSGDWMASTGSTANLEFTAYDQNKVGQIAITVPCNAAADTSKSMTATLTASASNGKPLNPDSKTLTYTITATTPAASSCTESNTPPADDTTTTDITAPVIDYTLNPREADGSNGWYRGIVSLTWTVTENESPNSLRPTGCVDQSITADQAETPYSCSATSTGGSADPVNVSIKRDATKPTNVQFSGGGLSNGASYDFGSVPAAPTECTANDATSGVASCVLSGGGTGVGNHTITATATDRAGNVETATLSYTVAPWTLKGFYSPVDYGTITNNTGSVWNTVKGGATVPLKFEVFNTISGTELTNTNIVNQPLKTTKISCATGASDEIELTATGSTSLRYDSTSGQFIYNWQTPKAPGTCYGVSATMLDGSSIPIAKFQLK